MAGEKVGAGVLQLSKLAPHGQSRGIAARIILLHIPLRSSFRPVSTGSRVESRDSGSQYCAPPFGRRARGHRAEFGVFRTSFGSRAFAKVQYGRDGGHRCSPGKWQNWATRQPPSKSDGMALREVRPLIREPLRRVGGRSRWGRLGAGRSGTRCWGVLGWKPRR
jgi:hypothetical protein